MPKLCTIKRILFLGLLWAVPLAMPQIASAQSACATVKIVIEQRVTLERQAFEATLTVANGLGVNLDDFTVTVWVRKTDDVSFLIRTPNTPEDTPESPADLEFFGNGTDDLFFFKPAQTEDDIAIAADTSQTYTYLLIPTQDAALSEDGTDYEVGANITYKVGTEEESIEVEPDSILVKPLPALTLEYFLPKSVIADNPNTVVTEPSEAFDLGVRVINSGIGDAENLQIESFQPKIEENPQGLLVEFRIISSEVNGSETTPSLIVNFGDLQAGHAETAAWQIMSTVYGRLTEARATFTHSDELGGQLTSLIQADGISVYRLVGKVDANGDGILDFLSVGNGSLGEKMTDGDFNARLTQAHDDTSNNVALIRIHPSGLLPNGGNPNASDISYAANHSPYVVNVDHENDQLTFGVENSPLAGVSGVDYSFIRVEDPRRGQYSIGSVIQDAGEVSIPRENFTLSTELAENSNGTINESADFEYYIDIFHVGNVSAGDAEIRYTVNYGAARSTNSAPVIVPLPNLPTFEVGDDISFEVEAIDPDGDAVTLTFLSKPDGAFFDQSGTFTEKSRALSDFQWTAQAGISSFSVEASDGINSSTASVTITVVDAGDSLAAWLAEYGVAEDALADDPDRDGYSSLLEFALNLDPTLASTENLPWVYVDSVTSKLVLECDVLAELDPNALDGTPIVELLAEVSADGFAWTQLSEVGSNLSTESPALAPGMVRLRWTDTVALAAPVSNRRYIRLSAKAVDPVNSLQHIQVYSPTFGGIELQVRPLSESSLGLPLSRASVMVAEVAQVAAAVLDADGFFFSQRIYLTDTIGLSGAYNSDSETGELLYYAEMTPATGPTLRLPIVGSGSNWITVSEDPYADGTTAFTAYYGEDDDTAGLRDLIYIRPYWTLETVFDDQVSHVTEYDALASRNGDAVILPDANAPRSGRIFQRYDSVDSWAELDATGIVRTTADSSTILSLDQAALAPGSAWSVRRATDSGYSIYLTGDASSLAYATVPEPAVGTQLEIPYAITESEPVLLDNSSLRDVFLPAASEAERQDELIFWDEDSAGFYPRAASRFYLETGTTTDVWRKVGHPTDDQGASVSLEPGKGYLIRRRR